MNVEAERIFGKHVEIRVPDYDLRHLRYPAGQQALIDQRLARLVPRQCETCSRLEKATARSHYDMTVHAMARCSMEKNGGGRCPDGMPVGSYKVQIVFHDDESMGESHIRVFNHDDLKGLSEEDRRKITKPRVTYPGFSEFNIEDFKRDWMNQPAPDEITSLKSAPINHDMPQTCGDEAW